MAQVTADGTTSTVVNQNGNDFTIEQGSRIGDNLFHSFDEFSVPTLGSASFNNATDIANIFNRVTGSNISNIDGLLSVNGAANLFLINPNGVIFGENARLNIAGSFFASTTDSLLFEGNQEFSTSNPQAIPLLAVNIPIGLSFRDNPGDIVNRASVHGLQVQEGKSITLVGGNINFDSGITAVRGGLIELGGISEAGIVTFNNDGNLDFPENIIQADITLSNAANVNVSGADSGDIIINARNLDIKSGASGFSIIRAGITDDSTLTNVKAGNITINATENIAIEGSSIVNQVFPGIVGNAGNITINATNLNLNNGSGINTVNLGTRNAGRISLNIAETLSAEKSSIVSSIEQNSRGNAGGIDIETGSLSLTNTAQIAAIILGEGAGGTITINADDDISLDSSIIVTNLDNNAIGNAGDIEITASNLELMNSSGISAVTRGMGNAGQISLNIAETISAKNSSIVSNVEGENGRGNTGGIDIDTGSLFITDTAQIAAIVLGEGTGGTIIINADDDIFLNSSNILANLDENAIGNAGDIEITASNLELINSSGISAVTRGMGNAGQISLNIAETLSLANSPIVSNVEGINGRGDAGGINIDTGSLFLTNSAQIAAIVVGEGNGGTITINVDDDIFLNSSSIISELEVNSAGKAGDIEITATKMNIANDSRIATETRGMGDAGDITVNARESIFITDVTDAIRSGIIANALVSYGDGGSINIFTNQLSINNGGTIEVGNIDRLNLLPSGTGEPGEINVEANLLGLSNEARIDAITQAETGDSANITLQIADDIILRNSSFISAQALENANGGNLTIDTEFIVAFPNQNNDIIANAKRGNGGRIDITAVSLFGIEERSLNLLTNDINASSDFGLQGDIFVNTPEVDPTSGLIELPEAVSDPSDQISQNPCEQGVGSEFIITGKGGLPSNPNETLNNNRVRVGLVDPVSSRQQEEIRDISLENLESEAVPAQGWIFNDKGEVMLTPDKPENTVIREVKPQNFLACSGGI